MPKVGMSYVVAIIITLVLLVSVLSKVREYRNARATAPPATDDSDTRIWSWRNSWEDQLDADCYQ